MPFPPTTAQLEARPGHTVPVATVRTLAFSAKEMGATAELLGRGITGCGPQFERTTYKIRTPPTGIPGPLCFVLVYRCTHIFHHLQLQDTPAVSLNQKVPMSGAWPCYPLCQRPSPLFHPSQSAQMLHPLQPCPRLALCPPHALPPSGCLGYTEP